MKSVEEIEDKGQAMYNFPKDVVKIDGGEFLILYNDTYNLCFKDVLCFYLYVKYYLGCLKCQHKSLLTMNPLLFYIQMLRDYEKLILIH